MRLAVQIPGQPDTVVELKASLLRIGRDPEGNDLVITHPHVSRKHCQLEKSDIPGLGTRWMLKDLGSSTGTTINGARVGAVGVQLRAEDVFSVGPALLRLEASSNLPALDSGLTTQSLETKTDEAKSKRSRLILLTLMSVMAFLWLDSDDEISRMKRGDAAERGASRQPQSSNSAAPLAPLSREEFRDPRRKEADASFQRGFREYLNNNYYRALIEFEGALRIFPQHSQAQGYKQETINMMATTANRELLLARQEIERHGRYRIARRRVERARDLIRFLPPSDETKLLQEESSKLLEFLAQLEEYNS